MKRIALAVNYDYHDYGGMLQAFATQQALQKLGVESEVINFDALKGDIDKRKWKYFIRNITDLSIVKEKGKVIEKKLRTKLNSELKEQQAQRDAAFDSFCHDRFKVSRRYESWEDLSGACREFDAVMVGSDQLWLPSNVAGDYYTLSFVPEGVRKIAYATSFGIGAIPQAMKKQYQAFLSKIEYLSARETSGQTIIKQCTGRDVPLVCDPTLLLETSDWDHVASSAHVPAEDYVFCYFMGNNPEQRAFVRRLAKKEHLKIVALLHLDQYIPEDEDYVDYAPYNVSPTEFVGLVKHAKYVCTDSFHGTVFSIIFSRKFFTFKRFNKRASLSTNTRLTSLLERLNLTDRLYSGFESADNITTLNDYESIQTRVKEFRRESVDYVLNSFDG